VPSHRFLFYSPSTESGDVAVELTLDEHHHLARVLRLGPGDEVFVTNGRGLRASCRVQDVGADRAALAVTGTESEPRGREVTLALALLRKEKFAQALEQCVELGIARCIPFVAVHSQIEPYGAGTMERLRRVAVSAMKQSFRAWLPEVTEPETFAGMVRRCAGGGIVAGEHGAAARPVVGSGALTVVVGPEAGLGDGEVDALRRTGATFASVSRHRLRSETAAVALVTAVLQVD
jgi:16S rRNA (uracil1498-N3)-methyltransferase